MGKGYRLGLNVIKKFWIAHFTFVKDRSLEGARVLEAEYKRTDQPAPDSLPRKSYLLFWLATLLPATLLCVAAGSAWFYSSFMRETAVTLGPGIHAILGGGGNSLVVEDGADVLLIDTKFPPGSEWLHAWVGHNVNRKYSLSLRSHGRKLALSRSGQDC